MEVIRQFNTPAALFPGKSVIGQFNTPAALFPGKSPVPIGYEAGGPQSRSGLCAPAGCRLPAVQPVVRRYANWDMPAPLD
jgi:hypothetical protein